MKRVFLTLFALLAATLAQAQHLHDNDHMDHGSLGDIGVGTGGATHSHAFVGIVPRLGLAVQKNLFAEVGVSLDIYRLGYTEASEYYSFSYSNLRPYVSGEVMVGRELIGGGKAGAEFIMSTPVFGMAAGAEVSYLTDGRASAVLITPRVMISLVYVEVYYGYNIFAQNHLRRAVGHHRFGVTVTLDGKFWKRKREVYEDYYNSYGVQ